MTDADTMSSGHYEVLLKCSGKLPAYDRRFGSLKPCLLGLVRRILHMTTDWLDGNCSLSGKRMKTGIQSDDFCMFVINDHELTWGWLSEDERAHEQGRHGYVDVEW